MRKINHMFCRCFNSFRAKIINARDLRVSSKARPTPIEFQKYFRIFDGLLLHFIFFSLLQFFFVLFLWVVIFQLEKCKKEEEEEKKVSRVREILQMNSKPSSRELKTVTMSI